MYVHAPAINDKTGGEGWRRGEAVQITRAGLFSVWIFVFLRNIIICRIYKLAFEDQAQVTWQLTVSLSDLA